MTGGAGGVIKLIATVGLKQACKTVAKKAIISGAAGVFSQFALQKTATALGIDPVYLQGGLAALQMVMLKYPNACFVKGTPVHTENGLVAIDQILTGQKVWAADPLTNEWQLKEVTQVYKNSYEGKLVKISFSKEDGSEESVTATANHPFWVENAGEEVETPYEVLGYNQKLHNSRYVQAEYLKLGDRFLLRSGEVAVVTATEVELAQTVVYNLEVADLHTYAVGASGALVHNKCRWSPGDSITKPINGRKPSWNTVRQRYWKNVHKQYKGNNSVTGKSGNKITVFSRRNMDRMRRGLAPRMKITTTDGRTKNVSMELHHKYLFQRGGGSATHGQWNLERATPWAHESMDPFRHTGYTLEKIIKGLNRY